MERGIDISGVLELLPCRTPDAWVSAALQDVLTLLLDHASLELKAAQQAQKLIWRYGAGSRVAGATYDSRLVHKMSRLAREELRHFEQVLALLEARGIAFEPVSASRYARELHAIVRNEEPGRYVDTLLVGAVIEARSCERFFSLLPALEPTDPTLASFYASLLRSEARHFGDYLALARTVGDPDFENRIQRFLACDAELVTTPDIETRFHSGVPA
jgi:tRNA-(ms[2]io[6]A)-hydroxylase